jgi:hypothetical protein
MPRLLYNALVDAHEKYCEDTDANFHLFLGTTILDYSHASLLRGMDGVLKEIYSSLIPPGREPSFPPCTHMYRVNIRYCGSSFEGNCVVSALANCGGWHNFNKPPNVDPDRTLWLGSLKTLPSYTRFLMHIFMTHYVVPFGRNDDDSYWNEMQIRERFRKFARINCDNPELCCGRCALLPGDTVTWEFKYVDHRQVKGFQPASKEELQERGWLMDPQHKECSDEECLGLLEAFAASARREQVMDQEGPAEDSAEDSEED